MKASLIAVATIGLSAPLTAQWLNQPTPGIPRASDGKPNLAAPAPRTPDGKPDLSGLWNKISPKYHRNIAADLKPEEIQSWAQALVEQRREDHDGHPHTERLRTTERYRRRDFGHLEIEMTLSDPGGVRKTLDGRRPRRIARRYRNDRIRLQRRPQRPGTLGR